MAKKRFTQDLFGLFEDQNPDEIGSPAPAEETEEDVKVSVPVKTINARKKLSSKDFTLNLDSFIKDESGNTRPPKRRRTGLDYLIRSTVNDEKGDAAGHRQSDSKRVTLTFKKEHLTTLKERARERNIYLKDLVQELVAQYLEQ